MVRSRKETFHRRPRLSAGSVLSGTYVVRNVLGAGGFGITYRADHKTKDETLAIKEYFPLDFAGRRNRAKQVSAKPNAGEDFDWGLVQFLDEARTLARFDHPNIVKVLAFFEANGTAYMVQGFEEGRTFKEWLQEIRDEAKDKPSRFPAQSELDSMLRPILAALELIHENDVFHRDIAPDNIIIRDNGTPVLIDFGSAREAISHHSKSVTAIIKSGYSPFEQYTSSGNQQGSWTDTYALGATLYEAISGEPPPEAPDRLIDDDYVPAGKAAKRKYRDSFLEAIDWALQVRPGDRPQSIREWRSSLLDDGQSPTPVPPSPGRQSQHLWTMGLGAAVLVLIAFIVADRTGTGTKGLTPPVAKNAHCESADAYRTAVGSSTPALRTYVERCNRDSGSYVHQARAVLNDRIFCESREIFENLQSKGGSQLRNYVDRCKPVSGPYVYNAEKALDDSNFCNIQSEFSNAKSAGIGALERYLSRCRPVGGHHVADADQALNIRRYCDQTNYVEDAERRGEDTLKAYISACSGVNGRFIPRARASLSDMMNNLCTSSGAKSEATLRQKAEDLIRRYYDDLHESGRNPRRNNDAFQKWSERTTPDDTRRLREKIQAVKRARLESVQVFIAGRSPALAQARAKAHVSTNANARPNQYECWTLTIDLECSNRDWLIAEMREAQKCS